MTKRLLCQKEDLLHDIEGPVVMEGKQDIEVLKVNEDRADPEVIEENKALRETLVQSDREVQLDLPPV